MTLEPRTAPLVPVSWGELLDKITILEIKQAEIADPVKLANVVLELTALSEALHNHLGQAVDLIGHLMDDLRAINRRLWDIEDDIRDCERARDFGSRFIELARSVYLTNDERARIKREINLAVGSTLIEEKSYATYTAA